MENPTDKDGLLLKHQWLARRFRCQNNNVDLMRVQYHYYRVRQVEPCHQLGWSSQALILSIVALGAMPKQQHQESESNLGYTREVPTRPKQSSTSTEAIFS